MSGARYIISTKTLFIFLHSPSLDGLILPGRVFTRKEYKKELVDSLNYYIQHKGLRVFAWCKMSNHIHLIASAKEGYKLSEIIRDLKKFTA